MTTPEHDAISLSLSPYLSLCHTHMHIGTGTRTRDREAIQKLKQIEPLVQSTLSSLFFSV